MDPTQRRITKIAREVSKFTVKMLKIDGVGVSEYDVIHVIRHNPGITQAEICKRLGIDKGALARQIRNLEAKGFLFRKENCDDKRSMKLYSTPKAQSLKNSKTHIETEFYEWLIDDIDKDKLEQFVEILDKIYLKCKTESKSDFSSMRAVIENEK